MAAVPEPIAASVNEVLKQQCQVIEKVASLWSKLEVQSEPLKKILGAGEFGVVRVFKLLKDEKICAGRIIHEEGWTCRSNPSLVEYETRYAQVVELLSRLDHRNIVQFLGVTFVHGRFLPSVLMELMMTSLHSYLKDTSDVLPMRLCLLTDIASGMAYLHGKWIVHHDLTATNVLLTQSEKRMIAKITDFDMAQYPKRDDDVQYSTLGTPVYMPPEAFQDPPSRSPKVDIFSFGHIALFTAIQIFPVSLLSSTYTTMEGALVARTEIDRRKKYFEFLSSKIPPTHLIVSLIKECLDDSPNSRPTAKEVEQRLTTKDDRMRKSSREKLEVTQLHLKEVIKALSLFKPQVLRELSKRWYDVGKMLLPGELSEQTSATILAKTEATGKPPLHQMLTIWLHHNPSWLTLVQALQSDCFSDIPGMAETIHSIQKKYTTSGIIADTNEDSVDVSWGVFAWPIDLHTSRRSSATHTRQASSGYFPPDDLRTKLRRFQVTGNVEVGRVLRRGTFSTIREVKVEGMIMAAKIIPDSLLTIDAKLVDKYLRECVAMSKLRHPNVIQFRGVHFSHECALPAMLMEKGEINLTSLLEHVKNIPFNVLVSLFVDIARGLWYLHNQLPPIIHQGITPKHILLDSLLVAKVTGLRWSRFIDDFTLTKVSSPYDYLPPEAFENYGTSLDVFSLGHLMLVTSVQCTENATIGAPFSTFTKQPQTEVERRQILFEMFQDKFGENHPLEGRIKECLSNVPYDRPTAENLLMSLETELQREWNPMAPVKIIRQLQLIKQGGEWVITQKMMAQYDHLFDRFDKSCDGFSERIDVESFFESSGLPHNTLDHIWQLCDISHTGQLNKEQFSLAMYLIGCALQGEPPPPTLAPNMVPPSLRDVPSLC